jgi:hypothetical protein
MERWQTQKTMRNVYSFIERESVGGKGTGARTLAYTNPAENTKEIGRSN